MRLRLSCATAAPLLFAIACGGDGSDDQRTGAERVTGERGADGGGATASGDGNGGRGGALQHLLSTGQSNSIGFASTPPLTTEQPFDNVMFDTGVMTARTCDDKGGKAYDKPKAFVPLVEGDAYFDYATETMSSAMANAITKGRGARMLASVHGRSGNTYECLRKGGCDFLLGEGYTSAFDEAMKQVTDAKALAAAAGIPYRVGAVTAVHGESDHYANPYPLPASSAGGAPLASYADALLEWQRDYDANIRALTGQTETVPLLVSQMSNWNDRPSSDIPLAQLDAHVRAPGRIFLVAPTYMLPFATDCIHFTNHGLRRLGEYFAKAYARVVVDGQRWEPLRPLDATVAGTAVRIRFSVPRPPLVIDTSNVTDPGNFGFEVVDESGSAMSIESVAVSAADAITITLTGATSAPAHVRYAMTAVPQTCPGPEMGPRGNVRDSDDAPSLNGYPLHNWAVHFDVPVR